MALAFSATDWLGPGLKLGRSLTTVKVIVNVWVGLSSVVPPPSSWAWRVTVETPFASAAGVYVSVPPELTAGRAEKSEGLVALSTMNETVW